MFRALPIEGHKNIIQPAIFALSRCLPFEGENKEIYQSGLVLNPPDAYQMGEKFSKSFIKIEFSCSIPWKEKIFSKKPYIFRVFVLYHLREKNIYDKGAVFDHPRCLPIEGRKIFFSKGLIFSLSRDLPIEERKIYRYPAKRLSPLGISEEKNNSIKAAHFAISRWLLFGGIFESNSRGFLTGEYVKKL